MEQAMLRDTLAYSVVGSRETVERLLAKRILASTTPYRVPLSRVACGIMNTPAEVESALSAIRSLG